MITISYCCNTDGRRSRSDPWYTYTLTAPSARYDSIWVDQLLRTDNGQTIKVPRGAPLLWPWLEDDDDDDDDADGATTIADSEAIIAAAAAAAFFAAAAVSFLAFFFCGGAEVSSTTATGRVRYRRVQCKFKIINQR